jgi:hypothetical protein
VFFSSFKTLTQLSIGIDHNNSICFYNLLHMSPKEVIIRCIIQYLKRRSIDMWRYCGVM